LNFTLKKADTEAEIKQAYQVRYQCLTLETGDELYADHEEKTFIDKLDATGKTSLFVVIDNNTNKVVATQRVVFRKDVVFTADEIYPYKKLATILNTTEEDVIARAALIDRSSVLKEYRINKPSLYSLLWYNSVDILRKKVSNPINVNFVSVNNQKAVNMMKNKFDLVALNDKTVYKGKEFYFLYKEL
jgi:hypothetical protein